jgi:hypothetical protein
MKQLLLWQAFSQAISMEQAFLQVDLCQTGLPASFIFVFGFVRQAFLQAEAVLGLPLCSAALASMLSKPYILPFGLLSAACRSIPIHADVSSLL